MLHHLPTWLRKISKNQKRKLKARQDQVRRSIARVELLEDRALMAVDLSLTKVGENMHTIAPLEDVMTSSFFQGDDLVRGYPGDFGRATLRVSTDGANGGSPGGETVYISFTADSIASLGGQIDRAVLTVQSTAGGFGGDASPAAPFKISAHAVDANPFTNIIDNTNPGGTTSWLNFYNNNILAADPAAVTVVKDFGALRFDVTGLVQNWASGTNTTFVIALTAKNDASSTDGNPNTNFLHGIRNNTEAPGSTFLTVTTPTTYTVTVNNAGPDAATGVSISDLVPAHFGTPTNISSGGAVVNGNDVEWTGLSIPAGGSLDLTYQVAEAFRGSLMAPSAANGAWDRPTASNPTPNATFQAWEAFTLPGGPNAPEVVPRADLPLTDGAFGGGLGVTWAPYNPRGTADTFDSSSATTGSMIISSGNIYSFSSAITPRVVVPNNVDGVAGDNANGYTTVFVQVHSTGSALNPDSMRLNGTIAPNEFAATSRFEDGSPGFGTGLRDTWAFEFRVPGNADVYTIDFAALQAHFSFDRIAVDTIWNPTATSASEAFSVGAPFKIINFAQVTAADQVDVNSTPNNGVAPNPVQDDEASNVFRLGNTPPQITSNGGGSSATTSFNENSTNGVTTVTVVDPQLPTQQLSFSLSGDDAARFNISPAGVLTFITPPNFEAPTDTNADNVYQVIVIVRDNGVPVTPVAGGTLLPGMGDSQLFNITVANVNEAPTDIALSTSTIAENAGINAPVGSFSSVDPETGNTFTYTLVAGAGDTGNAAFNISGNTLRATASLDFDVQNSYSVRVRSTDQGGQFFEEAFTITVTEAGAVNTLFVTGLTSGPSHIAVRFSKPIDPTQINLFDSNNAHGPSDITITGATTGPLAGSVVMDSDNQGFKFVKTGGLLAADTYTVTLRSGAANGFVAAVGGGQLDGNSNGTAGDNFSSPVTVTAPQAGTVTVGVGDFVRGAGQTVNLPTTSTNGIPITLSTGLNVAGTSFTLSYDPALLTITGGTSPIPGVSISVNTGVPGQVTVALSSASAFASSAGVITVVNLTAIVPASAPLGSKAFLNLQNVNVSDVSTADLPSIGDDGVQIAAYRGDLNNNNGITTGDVTALLRSISGALSTTGFPVLNSVDPALAGDMNDSGALTTGDGTGLLRFISGASGGFAQIPALPTGLTPTFGADPRIYIPTGLTVLPGAALQVPIRINVTEPAGISLAGFDVTFTYDTSRFTFGSVSTTGSLIDGLGFSSSNNTATPGQIRLVYAGDVGPNLASGLDGLLVTVTLNTLAGAAFGSSSLNVTAAAASDNDTNDLLIAPFPTAAANEANVDGSVNVSDGNLAPTAVSVTPNPVSIAENTPVPANLLVGNIIVTDDTLGTNNLTLAPGGDSSAFTISGNQLFLVSGTTLNFETKPTYTVTVRVDDPNVGNSPDATTTFTLNLTNVNEAPTDIALSSTTIAENAGVNAIVGNFSTLDPDAGNTFTYTLVPGAGDTGNGAFNISGNTLRANASFDFDTQSSYSIRVRSTDQNGLPLEEEFTITVTDGPAIVDLSITKTGANVHTLAPLEDVMTSAFFQGADLVRGYPGDANRATFRVTTSEDGPETVYISFSAAQIAALGSQIDRAVLTVTTIPGGFNLDPNPANPFTISAHAVNADPFTSITDNTNPGGTINWLDFYNNNILAADPAAISVVKDLGALRFDVTNLVQNWASGVNTQFVIAITGKNDTSGNEFFQGIRNNNNSPASLGSTFLTVNTPTTYTVTVNNAGPNTATGVSVSDVVPNYFGAPTAISNGGTVVNGNDVQWTGLVIPAGGSVNLTYQVAAGVGGGFIAPTTANGAWNRPTAANPNPNATFQGWEVFATTTGPNAPGTVPGPAFGGIAGDSWAPSNAAGVANAFDSSAPGSGSFVTGGGNIYSPGGVVTPQIVVPNNIDGVAGDNANGYTTILVQIKNGGTELNPDSVFLNGSIVPTEFALIARTGSGMGASDTWAFEFVVPGNADVYTINMSARESSLSLDRVSVDTIWNPTATSAAQAFSAGAPFKLVNFAQVIAADQTDSDSAPNNGNPNGPFQDDEAASTFRFGNTPPRISSNGGGAAGTTTVAENSADVTTVTIVDPQAATQYMTYSLSGTDAARFNISPTGVLAFIAAPNFEIPTDANLDNVYEVIVSARDSGTPSATGLADSQSLTVTVTNANEAPTIDAQSFTIAEAQQSGVINGNFEFPYVNPGLYTPGFTNPPEGFPFGWQIGGLGIEVVSEGWTGGAGPAYDGDQFADLNATAGAGGILQRMTTVPGQTYTLSFAYANNYVWTNQGNPATATVIINDGLVDLVAPLNISHGTSTSVNLDWTTASITFTATSTFTQIGFNSTVAGGSGGIYIDGVVVSQLPSNSVGTVVANDVDAGDTRTFAITAGNTGDAFAISPTTGQITIANPGAIDFETKPSFLLTVSVTDAGGLSASNTVTVNLTNVNEAPTIAPQTFSVAENSANTTAVGTVVAADVDAGDTRTFAITGGNTGGAFAIDPSTGAITVANSTALNFETTPTFSLTVSVTDAGTLSASNTVTVNLTNVNEAPTVVPQTFTIPENLANSTAVGVVASIEVDAGDLRTYAITGGNTGGAFAIDPNTAVITVANSSALNFETTPTFGLIVTATDSGGLSDSETITINLTNVNELPTIAPQTFSVAENSGTGTAVGTVVAADVDAGDTRTFAITGGNSGGAFSINPSTGAITVASTAALNFETTPTFSLTVSVTDAGTLSANNTVTVNLTNVNEEPTIAPQTFSIAENSANGAAVGTVLATDPDAGDARTFAITAGNTGGAFAINPSTGAITVANSSALNFEATPVFSLTVSVTDAGTLSDSDTVTINLTDVVEVNAINVTPTGLTTTEAGGTATFTIVLNSQPTADVVIPLSSNDTTEGTVSLASVTFTSTNWNVAQTITVTGVDDALVDGSVAYSIVTGAATSTDPAYNGRNAADVTGTNTDDEVVVPGTISVSPNAGLTTTEAGGVAAFIIVLDTAPTANVTIGLTSSDTTEGTITVASVTFTPTNWNVPQLVTVTGVNDDAVDGNVAYTIVTASSTSTDPSYDGINATDVSLTNFDNETGGGGNTPPTISDIANQTTDEDTPLTGIAFTVGDAQTAAASLTVTATSSNTALVPNANLILNGSGASRTLSVTPAGNQSGTTTITVTVSDGTTTTSDTFTLTVDAVNDEPTLNAINNPPAIPLNSGAQTISLTGITAGGGETQALTVTATSSDPALIPDPTVTYTSPNSTGSLSFTPVAGQSGTADITVTVSDGTLTTTQTFTVTVSGSGGGSPTTPGFVGIVPDPDVPGGRLLVINGTSNLDLINVYRFGLNQTLVLVPLSGVIRYFDNSAFDRVLINGFGGSDRIVLDPFFAKPTTINGDAGDDIILGGAGNDVIRGGEGVDVIYGMGGHDFIYGENGNDYLSGDDGNDVVVGGNSDDVIWGGFGSDVLNGGAGFDKIYGLSGDDLIIGGNLAQAGSQSSLQAIQSLWTANLPFNTRISNLSNEINSTNVTSDNSSDWIYGNDGRDWFVDYSLLDRFWDLNTNQNNGDRRN